MALKDVDETEPEHPIPRKPIIIEPPTGKMKEVDDHKSKKKITVSQGDRFETPIEDFEDIIMPIIERLGLPKPELDVFASTDRGDGKTDSKCFDWIDKSEDAMKIDWLMKDQYENRTIVPKTLFGNVPHSIYNKAIPRAIKQFDKFGFNMVFLVPSNNERTHYWHDEVEFNRMDFNPKGFIWYFPLHHVFYFRDKGEYILDKNGHKAHAQNGYKLVFFVGKDYVKSFKENRIKLWRWLYDKNNS